MKKYLALVVLGLMLFFVQPALAVCPGGCPVTEAPIVAPAPMATGAACPAPCPAPMITGPACPVAPACPAPCPTCPPKVNYVPVVEPVAPVVQTVVEPVTTYQYRQIATCPNPCPSPCAAAPISSCAPYGMTGAAAPVAPAIVYEEDEGFWSDFFGFD